MTQGLHATSDQKFSDLLQVHTLSCIPLSAGLGARLLALKYHFTVPGLGWMPLSLCLVPDGCFVPCVPEPVPAPLANPHRAKRDH